MEEWERALVEPVLAPLFDAAKVNTACGGWIWISRPFINYGDELVDDFRICDDPFLRVRKECRVVLSVTPAPPMPAPVHRPAKVAQMLALAHYCSGPSVEATWSTVTPRRTRRGLHGLGLLSSHVTCRCSRPPCKRASSSSIEAIDGVEPLAERTPRLVALAETWAEQRVLFDALSARKGSSLHQRLTATSIKT